tara:strand:+ start:890 stop:1303 length:414 start_codon:yes stop_codon:yes gene_type:complete
MPESSEHMGLVQELVEWTNIYFKNKNIIISSDTPDSSQKPPKIGRYIPDLYAKDLSTGEILIGEAKRITDLTNGTNNKKAFQQLREFIDFLAINNGGVLLMAVPLFARDGFESLIINLRTKYPVKNIKYFFTRDWPK